MRIGHMPAIPCQQHVHSCHTRSRNVKSIRHFFLSIAASFLLVLRYYINFLPYAIRARAPPCGPFGRSLTRSGSLRSFASAVHLPNRSSRTSSDIGWFLLGVPAPLPGRSLRTDLARFLASANDNFGQTKIVIRFSPVTDAIGRIRRCQRSTCVTAALPAPRRER